MTNKYIHTNICNVTCRLDKIERLLFELDYEVTNATNEIFVNFPKSPTLKVKRIFSPFTVLVTSSNPLQVAFIIKAMLGEKERFYIPLANKFHGIQPVCFRFWAQVSKYQENSKPFSRYKETQLGELGWDKRRFSTIVSTIYKYNYFIHLASFTLVRCDNVFESKEAVMTGVYSRKAVQRKTATRQFLI